MLVRLVSKVKKAFLYLQVARVLRVLIKVSELSCTGDS